MSDYHMAVMLGQSKVKAPAGYEEVGEIRCVDCGARYALFHIPAFRDEKRAFEEEVELVKRLRSDHSQSRHHDRSVAFDLGS